MCEAWLQRICNRRGRLRWRFCCIQLLFGKQQVQNLMERQDNIFQIKGLTRTLLDGRVILPISKMVQQLRFPRYQFFSAPRGASFVPFTCTYNFLWQPERRVLGGSWYNQSHPDYNVLNIEHCAGHFIIFSSSFSGKGLWGFGQCEES